MITYDFDRTNAASIKAQADKVLHKTLRQVLSPSQLANIERVLDPHHLGHFGNIVEQYIFDKKPDNNPGPDFPKANLELKTTPIKASKTKGYIAKERLVLGMIDYDKIINDKWEASSFLKKNTNLLILFYLFKDSLPLLDYEFKLIKLLNLLSDLSEADILQIRKDWEAIAAKIKAGKAHELSEGDTFYLGACTKGSTAAHSYRTQPNSTEKAKSRAFSLKQKYLNFIIAENRALLAQDHDEITAKYVPQPIETTVNSKLAGFLGKTVDDIQRELQVYLSDKSKSYFADLARAMLGARKKKIAEFEKADIEMKIIRLKKTGTPKESMSFPKIDYLEIVKENWDDSAMRELFDSKKFLFIIYKYDEKGALRFHKFLFWNMPYADLEGPVRKVWEETRRRIRDGHADALPGIKDTQVCHVRPHGRDSHDKAPTPYGAMVKKQSFWLNASYLKDQINAAK